MEGVADFQHAENVLALRFGKHTKRKCGGEAMPSMQYGCLYVRVGREQKTVDMIRHLFPDVKALAIGQLKHQSRNGVKSVVNAILLPGYVLFHAESDFEVRNFYTLEHVVRLLKYEDRSWGLRDDDRSFAEWIFRLNGLIGMSKAYREGTKVRIKEGPLKNLEGEIIRVDSRNRNAQISFGFNKQVFTAWLAFEWMDEADGKPILKSNDAC